MISKISQIVLTTTNATLHGSHVHLNNIPQCYITYGNIAIILLKAVMN